MDNERSISLCTTCERLPYCKSTIRFDTVLGCPEYICTNDEIKTSKEESKFTYEIFYGDKLVAYFSTIEDALLFIKASDSEYYAEPDWRYAIIRMGSK